MLCTDINTTETTYSCQFQYEFVINKWVIAVKVSNFSGKYLRNHWTLDIGVLGYIGIVWPKEHSPEVWSVPPVTPCIYMKRVNEGNKLLIFALSPFYQFLLPSPYYVQKNFYLRPDHKNP